MIYLWFLTSFCNFDILDILVIDQVKNDIEKLKQLIDNHEVVFLLMDTRESRWLPTLLAAVNNKVW